MMKVSQMQKSILAILVYYAVAVVCFLLSQERFVVNYYSIGQLCAILGLSGMVLQIILTSRIRLLDRVFGQGHLIKIHRLHGRVVLTLLIFHPLFLFGPLWVDGVSLVRILKAFSFSHWLGLTALAMLMATVFFAIFYKRIGISHELWRKLHRLVYIIAILGFAHSYLLGSDITSGKPLLYWWLLLIAFALLAVGNHYLYGIFYPRQSSQPTTEKTL